MAVLSVLAVDIEVGSVVEDFSVQDLYVSVNAIVTTMNSIV